MQTSLKCIEHAVNQWGIRGGEADNAFQSSLYITGKDPRTLKMGLPYCILQEIGNYSRQQTLMLHQFSIPAKREKLACFVTDLQGHVLERVYYGRNRRHWEASKQVELQLCNEIGRTELKAA